MIRLYMVKDYRLRTNSIKEDYNPVALTAVGLGRGIRPWTLSILLIQTLVEGDNLLQLVFLYIWRLILC